MKLQPAYVEAWFPPIKTNAKPAHVEDHHANAVAAPRLLTPNSRCSRTRPATGANVFVVGCTTSAARVNAKMANSSPCRTAAGGEQALEKYKNEIDDIRLGRVPSAQAIDTNGLRLNELCNRFLTSKLRRVESGELTSRTFKHYRDATDMLVEVSGSRRSIRDLRAALRCENPRSRLLLRSLNFRELTFHIRFHPIATVNNRESHKHSQSAYVSHSADFTGLGFHPVASLELHSFTSHESRRCRT
jgi:hypothetical protein